MRKCPFNDCGSHVRDSVFACRKHWFQLNGRDRAEIYAAYGAYMDDKISMDELRERQQAVLGERGVA